MKNRMTRFLDNSFFKGAMVVVLSLSTTIVCSQATFDLSSADDIQKSEEPRTFMVSTPVFSLELLNSSQTAVALRPVKESGFDFTTHEWLQERNEDGYYHLGDINFRLKTEEDTGWKSYSTAESRVPVKPLNPESAGILAAADLRSTLPGECPLQVHRFWEQLEDQLVLRFEMTNTGEKEVEIGALGIPMIFNNILNGKTLDSVHAENVFFDPYIGMDAGYLQVVRLSGEGPVLLVVPHGKTPFEAYRPLLNDPMPRSITFEGFHEWMVHSKAYAENEWKGVEQWNVPTSVTLGAGETHSFGIKFILADNVHSIEKTLLKHHRPVAVGIPGYVLPMDVDGKLFLKYQKEIQSIDVNPQGALTFNVVNEADGQWNVYQVKGEKWGRARLTITYADATRQTINYQVIKPEKELVADNGRFLTTEQWFDDPNDPFNRDPSVITYDNEKKEMVTQDSRAWIAGLSDEGGAGSWLNAMMKQLIQPDAAEVKKLEDFVNNTLWGGIQYDRGDRKYGVKKSLFYYEPDSMPKSTYSKDVNYNTWGAWSREAAASTGRSYNYPHVTAAHWVMYRLARNYTGLITEKSWDWYLENAFRTALAMVEQAPHYAQFGQMEGTIFLLVLDDLYREGRTDLARELESVMRVRANHWASLNYPFGSEMPWDSTGQEEVYMWSKYFGFDQKAAVTLSAILAYMPTIPHWAYNGNARRYWDFLFAGKLSRVERQIHHYGSALNAIPVLNAYKEKPDDFYLLRVGYGGLLGAVSNITEEGFAPCAFHSFPSTLKIDGISGDYGPGFFGYAVNSCSYIMEHPDFGWLAFGGNLQETKGWVTVDITTAAASRVFIAPISLELTLDAGTFKCVSFNPQTKEVRLHLDKRTSFTPEALLRVRSYNKIPLDASSIDEFRKNDRGLYVIPLNKNKTTLVKIKNGGKYSIVSPPRELGLDSFYKKYTNVNGIHIISSHRVPDSAIYAACRTIEFITSALPEAVHEQMVSKNTRVGIMARYEGTTDIPEHAHLANDTSLNWDLRARGLGGTLELPLTTCAEENLLCYQIDKYHAEDILIHEFAHSIHGIGILPLYPGFNARLQEKLDKAIAEGKYANTYAATNIWEYWAEGVQNWFDVNAEVPVADGKHNYVNTREELKVYDPELYAILSEFFPEGDIEVCPSCHAKVTRKTNNNNKQ